jgi:arsenate reductase
MANFTIYHNNRCGKSLSALAMLEEKGLSYQVRTYLTSPLSKSELRTLLRKLNIPAAELVRKNEELYKANYKGKDISEEEWISILHENPLLIERPIIETVTKAIVARPPERLMDLLPA